MSTATRHRQIYVNLPVRDLARSMAFYRALGYGFDAAYTNEQAAALVLGDNLYVMLLQQDFFRGFTSKPLADATQSTQVLLCVDCASRDEVDALVARALATGGSAPRPAKDHGFMYFHGYDDPDGHAWELMHQVAPPQG